MNAALPRLIAENRRNHRWLDGLWDHSSWLWFWRHVPSLGCWEADPWISEKSNRTELEHTPINVCVRYRGVLKFLSWNIGCNLLASTRQNQTPQSPPDQDVVATDRRPRTAEEWIVPVEIQARTVPAAARVPGLADLEFNRKASPVSISHL